MGNWNWKCFNFPVGIWSQTKRKGPIYNQAIWIKHVWIIRELKAAVFYLPCEYIIQWFVIIKKLLDFRLKDFALVI